MSTTTSPPKAPRFSLDWPSTDSLAVIAATISGRMPRAKPSDNTIRYNFVREDGKWRIDDISGTLDGEPWSIRDILSESLKEVV